MQNLYDCTVRLSGSMLNEVRRVGVTAAEIKVLKAVHTGPETGVEVVHSIVRSKPASVDRDDFEERARLEEEYGGAVSKMEHIKRLDALLGHETVPLPQSVMGVDALPSAKGGRRAKVEKAPEPKPEPEPADVEEPEFT